MNAGFSSVSDLWLARFAKLTVAATFLLILVGGHTTTSGAGMAFPDWPLSHGSINPHGWWEDTMQRLEHGHRYVAEAVGVMIGILCAWVWRSKWSVPWAFGGAALLALGCSLLGLSKPLVVHAALWSSVVIFLIFVSRDGARDVQPRGRVRWIALAAFAGVVVQAILGGLRVIKDPAGAIGGDAGTATVFRVLHACFAQIELCLLVVVAAMVSPAWNRTRARLEARSLPRIAWIAAAAVFVQLVLGATMRHLGAGLAIPTFPSVGEGWWPTVRDSYVEINFAHTRVGAVVVSLSILLVAWKVFRPPGKGSYLSRPTALLLALLAAQVTLGMMVIWKLRPPILTTLHVVTGAGVLATIVLIAVRACGSAGATEPRPLGKSLAHSQA